MKKAHHLTLKRRKIALVSMIIGVSFLLISAGLNLVYIKPSSFKAEFKKHQLDDCLRTTTNPETCYQKFSQK